MGAVSLPTQKGCILRAKVACANAPTTCQDYPFEPNHHMLADYEVTAVESVVVMEKGEILLPLENHTGNMLHLEAGVELGTVRNVDVPEPVDDGGQCTADNCAQHLMSTTSTVKMITPSPERIKKLLPVLCLPLEKLTPEESDQLKALILEFSDVFALDDSELGCTNMVQHQIDMGEHTPIRQQPYRSPVVRHEEMNNMVIAMQEQGIV